MSKNILYGVIGFALASLLFLYLNQQKEFISTFHVLLDLPNILNICSIIAMVISTVASVSGVYEKHVSILM